MTNEGKRFRLMTIEEWEVEHAKELSTQDGAERYGESRYREGFVAGYVQAINTMFELISKPMKFHDAYHRLWLFSQRGVLAQWARAPKSDPCYRNEPDKWPPKFKAE